MIFYCSDFEAYRQDELQHMDLIEEGQQGENKAMDEGQLEQGESCSGHAPPNLNCQSCYYKMNKGADSVRQVRTLFYRAKRKVQSALDNAEEAKKNPKMNKLTGKPTIFKESANYKTMLRMSQVVDKCIDLFEAEMDGQIPPWDFQQEMDVRHTEHVKLAKARGSNKKRKLNPSDEKAEE